MITVLLNVFLFVIKFLGGKISHSVAITSDAYNNLSDAVSTLFSWFGLKISSIGEGEHHPNGHGRFEWVITLISSISIILIGWELLRNSIESIRNPSLPMFSFFSLFVLIISILIKVFMYLYNSTKGKKNNSPSLKAIAIDCLSDAVSTTVVLVSLIVYTFFKINIDGWCGVLVSLFIMYNGFTAGVEIIEMIMGKRAPIEQIQELKKFILSNKHFIDVCNLQVEDFGNNRYRISGVILGDSTVDGNVLLKDLADLQFSIHKEYGYKTSLSIEKVLPVTDFVNKNIDELLKTISVPLVKQNVRLIEGTNQKIIILTLGISHENFSKMNTAENELKNSKLLDFSEYRIIPEVKLIRSEQRIHRRLHSKK